MVKRNLIIGLLILAASALVLTMPYVAGGANQPPHVPESGINCDSCHLPATDPVWAVGSDPDPDQNDPVNRICWTCHKDGGTAPFKKTHSSTAVNSTKYGDWKWNCVACHNPHQQAQVNFNTYVAALTGTISAINGPAKTFTLSISLPPRAGVGDATNLNDYAGWTIVPNRTYRTINYKIASNNGNSVVVTTTIATTRVAVGSQFGILPGKLVKDIVSTPGGAKNAKFFALEGPSSLVHNDGLAAGQDSTPDGICQICHAIRTEGQAMVRSRADGTLFGDGHPTDTSAYCMTCHDHSSLGLGGGGCTGCHGNPPVDAGTLMVKDKTGTAITSDSPGAGAHLKHSTSGLTCSNCHTGGMLSGAGAGDYLINIGFNLSGNLGGTYDGKTGRAVYTYAGGGTTAVTTGNTLNCSSVYCHSTGQGSTANDAIPTYATPSWNTPASGACGTCHKVTVASGLTSGSHSEHLSSAVTIGCGDCHTGAANDASSYVSTNHVNKAINVANSYTAGGAPGNGYGTCTVASCHGSGSPTWSNPTARTGCSRCHGDETANGNAAPGPDTAGDTATNDAQVGAHQTHLKGSNNYSSVIACTECHTVPATVQSAGHIQDATPGVAEVPLAGTLAVTNPNAVPGSPTYATGQCSNVYCHDSARFKNGWTGGTGHTPTWSNDAYLGADKAINCGTCHGNPPGGGHPVVAANSCNGCHANVNLAGDGFIDKTLHVNGILEAVAGCTGCHDANNLLSGKHGVHYASATDAASRLTTNTSTAGNYIFQCGNCHNDATGHPGTVGANLADVVFNVAWAPVTTGTYVANSPNGNDTTDSRGLKISTDGSCSNLYCHSNGLGGAPNTAAVWNGVATTCESCHNYDAAAVNKMASGSHTTHINDGTIMTNKGCQECHNATTTNGTSIADKTQHVDGGKDVHISATYDSDATPGNNWNSGTSTCSNVYCHSTGEATPTYKPVVWGTTISNCEACHNYDAAATNKMSTGSHTEHINNAAVIATNYGCQECHNSTTTNGTSITTPANHVNKTRDVSIVKGGTWTSPNCTSTYCHSTGQATPTYVNPPAWGSVTDLTCDSCHGTEGGAVAGMPAYANGALPAVVENNDNSHAAHVSVSSDCTICHTDTTSDGTTIKAGSALHTNQTRNINFAAAYDANGGTNSDNYNAGTKTCSSITCHGAGTPMWGGASLACNACHLANNTLQGAHAKHYGSAAVAVSRNDSRTASGTAYIFNCGVCHNATSHATGNVSGIQAANVSFGATHAISGSYAAGAVLAGTDSGGMEWTNGTCSTTYCHSQGTSTTSPFGGAGNTAATWSGAAMTCEGCHNFNAAATNKMSTGNHTEHINNAAVIATNYGCQECHNTTSSDGATITNEDNHVNKVKDVSIVKGGTWTSPNCTSTYCHSTGQATPTYVNPPAWGSVTDLTCDSCHGTEGGAVAGMPAYANGALPAVVENNDNSHAAHVSAAADCSKCHTDTTSDGTTIKAGSALHTNQTRNINFAAAYDANGGTNSDNYNAGAKTCSSITCHGASTPMWGGTVACGSCHVANNTIAGSHAAHYQTATTASDRTAVNNSTAAEYRFNCGICHFNTAHGTGPVNGNRTADVVFDGTIGNGTFTEGGVSTPDATTGYEYTNSTCSTSYCHGNFGGNGNIATPTWGTAASGACGTCHDVDSSATMSGGSHQAHVKTLGLTCDFCHSQTAVNAAGGILDKSVHANGLLNWNLNETKSQLSASSTYDPDGAGAAPAANSGTTTTGAAPYGNCNNVYCHSNVQTTPPGGALTYTQPQWGGTVNCGGCHKTGPFGPGADQDSGSHLIHVSTTQYNITCSKCHQGAGSGTANHANYAVNVAIDATYGASASYNGSLAPGDAYGSCSSVVCHSIGDTAVGAGQLPGAYAGSIYATPAWNTSLVCNSCHGRTTANGAPDYTSGAVATATANTHTQHAVTSAISCSECHYNTTNNGTTINYASGLHVNQINTDVVFDPTGPNTGATYNSAVGTKQCSTTYCHGTGTPQWGGAALNCAGCHKANNTLAGKHAKHYGSATLAVAADRTTATNTSSGTAYLYSCAVCHTGANHAKGVVTVNQAAEIGFGNTIAVGGSYVAGALQGSDGGFNWTNGACSATYCHSQGQSTTSPYGGAPNNTTFTWAAASTLTCEGCHSYDAAATNKMASGNHTEHMNNTAVIGTNYGCQECHNSTTTNGTSITDTANHVNKTKDVSIVKGGSWASPTCSNVYCHSSGQATPAYRVVPNWGSATDITCDGCHGTEGGTAFGEPAYASGAAGSPTANSHSAHVSAAADCATCHTDTVTAAGTAIKLASTLHTNQARNVNFAAAVDNNGGTNSDNYNAGTKTCSSISCHGTGAPVWGNNSTNDTCTKCHGTPTVTVDGTNRYVVAPPVNTAGTSGTATDTGQVSNDAKVGAHQTHLRILNLLRSSAIETLDNRCEYCHGTLPVVGSHANGSSTPAFQGLASNSGAMSPAPSYAGTTCNNTYCHNPAGTGGTLNSANAGTGTAPVWTNAAYVADGTLKTVANCGVCHKSPWDAGFTSTYSHGAMTTATDCSGCHGHNGDTLGSAGQRHMDGTKYGAGSCNSCHGYESASWAAATERAPEGKGAHAKHVAHLVARWGGSLNPSTDQFGSGASWTNVCGVCHNGATHTTSEAIGGNGRQISVVASHQFGPSAPSYSGVPATSSSVNPKSCSNIDCHFQQTPVWASY